MKETAETDNNVYMIPQSSNKGSPDYYPKNPPPIGHYVCASMKRISEKIFSTMEKSKTGRATSIQ